MPEREWEIHEGRLEQRAGAEFLARNRCRAGAAAQAPPPPSLPPGFPSFPEATRPPQIQPLRLPAPLPSAGSLPQIRSRPLGGEGLPLSCLLAGQDDGRSERGRGPEAEVDAAVVPGGWSGRGRHADGGGDGGARRARGYAACYRLASGVRTA